MNNRQFRYITCLICLWGGVFAALLFRILQRLA